MIEFRLTIQIDQPVAEVFTFLSDFRNIPKWNYYVVQVTKTSDGPVMVGSRFHQVRKTDEQDFSVTEFLPHHRMAVKTLPHGSPQFMRRFTLWVEGMSTQILDEWELELGKPRFIERLAAGRVESGVAENLGKLKELLETGAVTLQDGRRVIR